MVSIERDRLEGCLLGGMVGDALGLPREGLSRRRAARLFRGPVRHAFILGRGMCSDDTEHAIFTAQALLRAGHADSEKFARSLAWKLRLWLLGLPAGIGKATLRAIVKLWVGFPPSRAGVFSAGNGPAMRAPILGAALARSEWKVLESFVGASTLLTHSDPKAMRGALAVARAAAYAATHTRDNWDDEELRDEIEACFPPEDKEAHAWLECVRRGVAEDWAADRFCEECGFPGGPSGYIYQTLPVVFWAWLCDPFDFRGGMERVLSLAGDADTTAAIYGGLAGAAAGAEAIPAEWIAGVAEFPRTVGWMRRLAASLARQSAGEKTGPLPLPLWPLIVPRNLLFLAVVLLHGMRRLAPPY